MSARSAVDFAASGGSSYARRGQPLLENLPNNTPEGSPIVYLTFDDGPNAAGPNWCAL